MTWNDDWDSSNWEDYFNVGEEQLQYDEPNFDDYIFSLFLFVVFSLNQWLCVLRPNILFLQYKYFLLL